MAYSSGNLQIWVKPEPFNYGSLPVPPYSKLSIYNIKKIIPYTHAKDTEIYPMLSYNVWRHIACNKLSMSDEQAWMYFSLCYDLTEDVSYMGIDRNSVSVNRFKLVIFLYIQQIHRVSLKASLISGEEWPNLSQSDLKSSPRQSGSDENSHLQFVQTNLHDILEITSEPGVSESLVSLKAVEALGFLFGVSIDGGRSPFTFHSAALLATQQDMNGYSKLSRLFSAKILQTWITHYLSWNPFGLSSCLINGKRLTWPLSVTINNGDKQSMGRRGKAVTNLNLISRDSSPGDKLVILTHMSRQTVARSSPLLEDSTVKIHRCHCSYLYLLSPLRSVTIEKCRHSTIFLGPVRTNLVLSHCEQVILVAPTFHVAVTSCSSCVLYLLTPNPPLLLSGNDNIYLAPYNTFYPSVNEHLEHIGLRTNIQSWDKPLCEGPDHDRDKPIWQQLPTSDFFVFNIPFHMDGLTRSIPGGLPNIYQDKIDLRNNDFQLWQTRWLEKVKEFRLDDTQKMDLQKSVELNFQAWLHETGYKTELDSLVQSMYPQTEKL